MLAQLPINHPCYAAEDKIRTLLRPLLKLANIHYFSYGEDLLNQSGFMLTSHVDYYEKWFDNAFVTHRHSLPTGWYLIDRLHSKKELELAQAYEIGHKLMYVSNETGRVRHMVFGSTPDNQKIADFYINNREILKLFSEHFANEASPFITLAKNQLLTRTPSFLTVHSPEKDESDLLKLFLNDIQHPINQLSPREMKCYRMFLKGYTYAEMGQVLALSPKTVNTYVTRIKEKLGCTSRHDLMEYSIAIGLVTHLLAS